MNSADVTEITQLILHERQGRDRGWWRQMRDAFASDSTVRLSWYRGDGPGFVNESERMGKKGDKAIHRLSPPVIHVEGDRAIAEMSCSVEFQVRIHQVPAHLVSYTRLNYRLQKQPDGGWTVTQLDAIYERDTLTPAVPGSRIDLTSAAVDGYRPSYALLAYYLSGKGYTIAEDLLGDDRPENVNEFYSELIDWLHADGTPGGQES